MIPGMAEKTYGAKTGPVTVMKAAYICDCPSAAVTMEPGVNRVIREPAVMLPLLGAEMSLGNAW